MNHAVLIARVAAQSGEPAATVKRILAELASVVGDELADGGSVAVSRLGTFAPKWHAGGVVRDIRTGRKHAYDGRWSVRFRPASRLRSGLADTSESFLKQPAHQRAWQLADALTGDLARYHADRAPQGLTDDTPLLHAQKLCADSFGEAWTLARATFDAATPEEVRTARDYLVRAARVRWGGGR